MQAPPVIVINRSVDRTAFDLGANAATLPLDCLRLAIHRQGCRIKDITYTALEIDSFGRVVFAWDDCFYCLEPGLYTGIFYVNHCHCGTVTFQLSEPCGVMDYENIGAPAICPAIDCLTPCGTSMPTSCQPPLEIYTPAYPISRGC